MRQRWSSEPSGLWLAGSFLAMRKLAGLLSCMTAKYLARLLRACLSCKTMVASGLRRDHIFLIYWVGGVMYKG